MTAVEFPLLSNTQSPIQRDSHTLFVKYRYADVFLQYLASSYYYDNKLMSVIYYDICTIAIKSYITRKVLHYGFPLDLVSFLIHDLYTNYDPEVFDIILHKSFHHIIQTIFYVQPRHKRPNKYEDIHEVTNVNEIYSAMFGLFTTDPADFDVDDLSNYFADNNSLTIVDYIADYIVLAKRMQVQNYRMVDLIQHLIHRIRDYMREYYSLIYQSSYVRYRVTLTNERLNVDFVPNTTRIQFIEKKIAQKVFSPTPECLGLGIASVHLGRYANSPESSEIEHYLRRYKSKGKVNIKPLQTVKGRSLRVRHLFTAGECPNRTTRALSELITKFNNAFPNPEVNAAKYTNRMNYGLNYTAEAYSTMRQFVHRLLKLRTLIYLTLHAYIDLDNCAGLYNWHVEPVARLAKFRFPDIICLRSDYDYKLLDIMLTCRKLLNNLQTFLSTVNVDIGNNLDIANELLVNDAVLMTKSMATFMHDRLPYRSGPSHQISMKDEYKAFVKSDVQRLNAMLTNLKFELLADAQAIYNLDLEIEYAREKVHELMIKFKANKPIDDPEASHLVYIRIDPSKMGGRIGHLTDDDPDYLPEEDDVPSSWDDYEDYGYEGMP